MSKINGSIDRRNFIHLLGLGGVGLGAIASGSLVWDIKEALADSIETNSADLTPDTALARLLDGNKRFVQQKLKHPHQSKSRLGEVATAQHPFATILSCADSRVPPEILFDEGIGDIFDVRLAGNIVTPEALGSIEYSAILLGTPLLMVLGHERCGAVTAAVKGEQVPGAISSFVKSIEPALKSAKKNPSGDPVEDAVVANVKYQVDRLRKTSELLVQREQEGKLKIVGARYDLDKGEVTIIS
jgi:carbonic anhydrase